MRFAIQHKVQTGSIREVKKFAWLPTKTDDDYIVWLEFYKLKQKYDYFINDKGLEVLKWGDWAKFIYK